MDTQTLQTLTDFADSVTSLALCLFFIWYLMKRLERAEDFMYSSLDKKEIRDSMKKDSE